MKKNILAIIPARGGSKGIRLKNIQKLNNFPLIINTFLRLKKSRKIDSIICSTDNNKIIKICKDYKLNFIKRKKKYSLDNSNINDALFDILKNQVADDYKYILLAQPTNPFINKKIIDKLLTKIGKSKFNSVQTIVETPHIYHPINQRHINKDEVFFINKKIRKKFFNKQKKNKSFSFGNLVVFKKKEFLTQKNVFCEPSGYEIIDKFNGLDIDFKDDLILANLIARNLNI